MAVTRKPEADRLPISQRIDSRMPNPGRRKMTPGRPVTFVVTEQFLDHFGLEATRDLPGLKELRAAGLLDNRPPPGTAPETEEGADDDSQSDMFRPPLDPEVEDESGPEDGA